MAGHQKKSSNSWQPIVNRISKYTTWGKYTMKQKRKELTDREQDREQQEA